MSKLFFFAALFAAASLTSPAFAAGGNGACRVDINACGYAGDGVKHNSNNAPQGTQGLHDQSSINAVVKTKKTIK
jgi:hypothetical protein